MTICGLWPCCSRVWPQDRMVGLARALVRNAGSQLPTPHPTEWGLQMIQANAEVWEALPWRAQARIRVRDMGSLVWNSVGTRWEWKQVRNKQVEAQVRGQWGCCQHQGVLEPASTCCGRVVCRYVQTEGWKAEILYLAANLDVGAQEAHLVLSP